MAGKASAWLGKFGGGADPDSPRARLRSGGCALPVALLLAGVGLLARRPTRRRS